MRRDRGLCRPTREPKWRAAFARTASMLGPPFSIDMSAHDIARIAAARDRVWGRN